MKKVEIVYTQTFEQTVDNAIIHWSQWSEESTIIEKIEGLIEYFETKVGKNPYIYSLCSELVPLGNTDIREMKRENTRVLYEVDEQEEQLVITVLLFLGQKQSIQNQLIDHCILYK
ncbi:type II toxin-antitoxin system RelE/ParE family toxin [uncultured Shewanella sp.]|uniref:type II toxin-antitoxin system RelE/ParE family toxin n=1 Tax=uncultured Shewanella sp. TaxID=173975 RepID=UPI002613299A|nr:type II toxin-antitoxin system RelE/ParE family toxin [uncultured Shewanella sp.]